MAHRGEAGANVVDDPRVLVVHQQDRHARVVQDVFVVRRHQAVVERNQNCADLARGVKTLKEKVGVRTQDADAVVGFHAQTQERMRQPVHARLQLRIRVAPRAVHHRSLVGIELHGTAQKVIGEKRNFHEYPLTSVAGAMLPLSGGTFPEGVSGRHPATAITR